MIGRFTSPDPVTQDLYAPQLLNSYSYVGNNPLLYIDPTGNFRSAEWQRATVPGQVSFDYGMTAAENKQYLRAGLHFAAMVGEQVMFVLSAGAVQAEVAAAQTTGQALKALAKEGAEEAIGGPLPTNPKKLLKNAAASKGGAKTAQEMAADLQRQLGKNSVEFRTPSTKGHIDLAGAAHFDKATQTKIPTPHVQTKSVNVGPNGRINLGRETTKAATKQDIRTAKKLSERRGGL